MKLKKLLLSNSLILTLAAILLIAGLLGEWGPLQLPELKVYDHLLRWKSHTAPSRVVMVAIDDASIQELGMWPWPRTTIAQGLQRLSAYNTRAVGLTTVFPAPSPNPALAELSQWRTTLEAESSPPRKKANRKVVRSIRKIEKRLDEDQHLINAVRSGRNMVLPFHLMFTALADGQSPPLSGLLRLNSLAQPNQPDHAPPTLPDQMQHFLYQIQPKPPAPTYVIETYRALAGKAAALGAINLSVDPDGRVRQLRLLWPFQKRYLPSLALQLVIKSAGRPLRQADLNPAACDPFGLCIGDTAIPTDADFRMRIAYHPRPARLNQVPFADLVAEKVDPAIFKDQVVIIGVTAKDLTSTYPTPLGSRATPAEIFAAAVDTILRNDHVVRPRWALLAEGGALLYFLLFLLLVIPRVKLPIGALILTVFLTTYWGAAVMAFVQGGYWLHLSPPLILCLLGFGMIALRQIARRLRAENVELNRSLGLSFQTQGMLDMALEKFMQCPPGEKTVRRLLYNLGLDFERKRMPDKALTVYERILKGGGYRDAKRRVRKLKAAVRLATVAVLPEGPVATLKLTDTETRPTFGRYEILKELGQGAMGTVYLGLDPKINRQVAIKTLSYSSVPTEELAEVKTRFLREAEAAGRLSHPNIVTIYDIGEEHDHAYMAMELLDGCDLTAYCRSDDLAPVVKVLDIMIAVAEALEYAHDAGVIHRDIKPANIMRLKDGRVKVTDFGIAKVMDSAKTRTGIVMGTPSYMSPEQVGGKKVDGRSDLFSLGIVFYEMLTGHKPFEGENLTALMYAIAKAPYRPLPEMVPDMPPCCVAIVNKMLYKGVSRRYKSAKQLQEALRQCREALG
jgi:CHASE2 domain-containing sensor protein